MKNNNVGKIDRFVRFTFGIGFLILGIISSWWLLIISAFFFYTGYAGFCGIYKLLGINTCKS
ncbi:MAG: DUF2892 domain-containing protein [Candidatus Izemoplasma sp.]